VTPLQKRHKYGVAPKPDRTNRDGIVFDSKGEMLRWESLRLLERVGEISGLDRQVEFPFSLRIGPKWPPDRPGLAWDLHFIEETMAYVADFVYRTPSGELVVEDFKGVRTEEYRWKKKLMRKVYGIKILETGTPSRSRARSTKRRPGRTGAK
jgi:hypothetical protein